MAAELLDFARASGYVAAPCPDCSHTRAEPCPNCGGSGRLWRSPRGSLSDDGLARLHALIAD